MPVNKFTWIDPDNPANVLDFTFITIEGFPEFAKPQFAIETRLGSHGHATWFLGNRGKPFELYTFRDSLDQADIENTIGNYRDLATAKQVIITWNDIQLSEKYEVLDVRIQQVKATTVSVGGFISAAGGSSGGYIEAIWTVIPIVGVDGKTTKP